MWDQRLRWLNVKGVLKHGILSYMGEEDKIVKTIKLKRNFSYPGNMGAWEAPGRLQNREKSQRGRLHRRQLSGRQDEREGRFLQSAEPIKPLLQVVVKFQDDTWLEGFFKDGILHGFCRYFDSKGRLTFVGMHRNGKPFGTCWKVGWWDLGSIIIFLTHSLTKVNFGEIFGKGEDSPQVIYCGVQKGMIDSSRLCNKGLTNRETV